MLASGWAAFIYILKGTLIVGRESIPQEQYHTLVLSTNANETGVLLKSGSDDTEFMLVRRSHTILSVHGLVDWLYLYYRALRNPSMSPSSNTVLSS